MPMPKYLDKIGMGVFISEFEYFATKPKSSDTYLVNQKICNAGGARRRINNAKYLFDDPKLLHEALEYIAYTSPKATSQQKEKANKLLKGL
jgi:hypothetical protein